MTVTGCGEWRTREGQDEEWYRELALLVISRFFLKYRYFFIFIFRVRGREGEREREKRQSVASLTSPNLGPNLQRGRRSDQEGNLRPFSLRAEPSRLSHTGQGGVVFLFIRGTIQTKLDEALNFFSIFHIEYFKRNAFQ